MEYGLSTEEISRAMLQAFVIFFLYQQGAISTGKAAQILGIERLEFIELLAAQGIPFIDYTLDEFRSELETLDACLTK